MIVCVSEPVQWRWARNDRLARGYLAAVIAAGVAPGTGDAVDAGGAAVSTEVHSAVDLGFGRIVVSETEAPNMCLNLV